MPDKTKDFMEENNIYVMIWPAVSYVMNFFERIQDHIVQVKTWTCKHRWTFMFNCFSDGMK